jgi:hypothetical protein
MLKSILLVFASVLFVFAQVRSPAAPAGVRTADNALLPIPGAVLYNNVYGKGNVTNYKQSVFHGKNNTGWDWDWPESGGPSLKTYPEVLVGRSPRSDAGGLAGAAGLSAGRQLPVGCRKRTWPSISTSLPAPPGSGLRVSTSGSPTPTIQPRKTSKVILRFGP